MKLGERGQPQSKGMSNSRQARPRSFFYGLTIKKKAARTKMATFNKIIGQKIKALRLIKRLSQEKLGEKLGVSTQQVQKYENGTNRMAAEKILQCANIFEVAVSYFFEECTNLPLEGDAEMKVILASAGDILLIRSPCVRMRVCALIQSLATDTVYEISTQRRG